MLNAKRTFMVKEKEIMSIGTASPSSLKSFNFASFLDLSEIIQVSSYSVCKLEDAYEDKLGQRFPSCLWSELAR